MLLPNPEVPPHIIPHFGRRSTSHLPASNRRNEHEDHDENAEYNKPELHRLRSLRRGALPDVDATLEVRAVLDDDARRLDVPDQLSVLADVNLLGRLDAAFHLPHDHHLARLDAAGLKVAVGTDR